FSLGSLCIIQLLIHSAVAIAEEETLEQREIKKQQLMSSNSFFLFSTITFNFMAIVDKIVYLIDITGEIPTLTEAHQIFLETNQEIFQSKTELSVLEEFMLTLLETKGELFNFSEILLETKKELSKHFRIRFLER
ncbi:MAG: hypothetical protein OXC37_02135, partial [Bdellovibrionaceae bacterium]|nr:hypothetical protein [Pseudobdellovibrionaceae bacterium]